MTNEEFEQFVRDNGKDILRFCRMQTGDMDRGEDLYQDTMELLLRKIKKLDSGANLKSYALSVAILLEKNHKRKYSVRNRIALFTSYEQEREEKGDIRIDESSPSPEHEVMKNDLHQAVRNAASLLPYNLRTPLLLYYSSEMKIREIAQILSIPEGTVKSRIRKAKSIIMDRLEKQGYE